MGREHGLECFLDRLLSVKADDRVGYGAHFEHGPRSDLVLTSQPQQLLGEIPMTRHHAARTRPSASAA
jgi:hypothetical protein